VTRFDRDALLAGVELAELADELLGGRHGSDRSPTWVCPIPTHAQTGQTPPLSVFVTRWGEQRWRCHGCGASGSAIDLVMQAHGLDVRQAMEWLGRRTRTAPIERPANSGPARRRNDPPRFEPNPAIDDYVAACEQILWSRAGAGPRRWLTETRCLSEQVLRANRVGFDPGARRLGRPVGVPRSAGVILPVLDDDHRAVFTQTRRLGETNGPRYLNCASKAAPNPRLGLYRGGARSANALIVCEGVIDALTAADAGFDALALLGSSIADDRVSDEVARTTASILLAFDADDAGDAGATRLARHLSDRGRTATRLRPDSGYIDLNEWRAGVGGDWVRVLSERVENVLAALDLTLQR
jgi:DNA primase